MKSRIQKWGNSLALRIPKSFALEAGLSEDAAVELCLEQGRLVVNPATPQPPTLEEMVRGMKRSNLHEAWDTGPPVGKEML